MASDNMMSAEERISELKACIELLRQADALRDRARELYLGEHQARNYGSPVSRLLNLGLQWEAIILLIEEEIEDLEKF